MEWISTPQKPVLNHPQQDICIVNMPSHEIGSSVTETNHSNEEITFTSLSEEELQNDLQNTEEPVTDVTGNHEPLIISTDVSWLETQFISEIESTIYSTPLKILHNNATDGSCLPRWIGGTIYQVHLNYVSLQLCMTFQPLWYPI